ncbi:MAG: hybrid sensor histidine kinase/response regulator [bacterium]|nr:hybrid sensor histidine kinase/response regulator [bacterium]
MQNSEFLKQTDTRILVVDDDPELCILLRDILSNYEVDVLHDGSQVSGQLAGQQYDILISDLHMPGLSGLELLQVLKPHYPDLEILLLTGGGSVETAVEAMKLGASEFLLKPVRVGELREAVKRARERMDQGRENRLLKQLYHKQKSLEDMRERFVTLIAHELSTPLTSLRFVASEFMEQCNQDQTLVSIFQSSLDALEVLADDMRWLSEGTDAPIPLQDQLINPPELIKSLLQEMHNKIANRELNLVYEGNESWEWTGDPRRLRQIAGELISNSIRATPNGGTIRVGVVLEERDLILEVVDNGIGIPKDKVATIFEPFQTLAAVETHHSSEDEHLGGGLGVGLGIIRDVIKRMGGNIGVVSNIGEGCNIEVRLKENATQLQIEKATRAFSEMEAPEPPGIQEDKTQGTIPAEEPAECSETDPLNKVFSL